MDAPRAQRNAARVAGAILGVGIALALVLASRPAAMDAALPAAVRVSLGPAGELEATPAPPRPVLVANRLLPGGSAFGASFRLRNQAGGPLAIALRARADSTALNGLLRVRLATAAGRPLADTTLQGLRQRPVGLRLGVGRGASFRIQAWIPAGVLSGYEGRIVHVSLDPEARALGAGR